MDEPMSEEWAEAERSLMQAQTIMRAGRPKDAAEEWLLLASLIGEADLTFQAIRKRNSSVKFPLLEAAIGELYEMTAGFTDPAFLRQTRAARRRNRALFG
jgi:hypothetical protein